MNETDGVPGLLTSDVPERLRDRAASITVLGDVILDGWWFGRASRMSREAPAPVVDIRERRWAAGGAANTAVNLASLGARVRLVGIVGDDEAGRRLRALLVDAGVDVEGLIVATGAATTRKVRIFGDDQMFARVDDGGTVDDPDGLADELLAAIDAATDGADAEILCDYGYSMWTPRVRDAVVHRARRPPLTVVDAHEVRRWHDLRADLVTPNAAEAALLCGPPDGDEDRASHFGRCALEVLSACGADHAIVTLDREGTVLLGPDGVRHRTHAHPHPERRASGAGDTFVAALTLGIVADLAIEDAADLAQIAADVVVQRLGTSVCTTADLEEQLGEPAATIADAWRLAGRLDEERANGRRVVFTNGCFDVLHRGHTSYLRQARRLGDVLVVALNSDESVRRLKGPDRPVNPASDRAAVVAALDCVDYVTIFDDDSPVALIEQLRPEVYAKGGDYTIEMLDEGRAVAAYGGEVRILDYVADRSTTSIVQRIRSGAVVPDPGP